MHADDKFNEILNYWKENENKYLPYIVGWEFKVDEAAKKGMYICAVAVVPAEIVPFCAYYFESMGYFVQVQPANPNEWTISLDCHNKPYFSRFLQLDKQSEEINVQEKEEKNEIDISNDNLEASTNKLLAQMQRFICDIQSGKFGEPSSESLRFCGSLHKALEMGQSVVS